MKKLSEEKYLKTFAKNSTLTLQQLQLLIQLIKSPKSGVTTNTAFIKNILIEYNLLATHANHHLVLVVMAMIAAHEKKTQEFHFLLTKIIYIGQFDSVFLCLSLTSISRFLGEFDICKHIYHELGQNEIMDLVHLDGLVNKSAEEFGDIMRTNDIHEITQFYMHSKSRFHILCSTNDLAFQYFISTQSIISIESLITLWKTLFFSILCDSVEKLPNPKEDLAIALLSVLFNRKSVYLKVSKIISLSNILNYLSDYVNEPEKITFLLKILSFYLKKTGKIQSLEKQNVMNLILGLVFNTKTNTTTLSEAFTVLKTLLKFSEYDPDYLTALRDFLNQYLRSSDFNPELLKERIGNLMRFLDVEYLPIVYNSLLEILLKDRHYSIIANTLAVIPHSHAEVVVATSISLDMPDESEKSLEISKNYIYYYHYSRMISFAENVSEFNTLVSLIINSLNRNPQQCEAALRLIINILRQHGHHYVYNKVQPFGCIQTSNKKRLSKAFLVYVNETAQTITVLKFITYIGKDLVEHFDLEFPDINAILMSIINFLSLHAADLEVITECVTLLGKMISEKDNIICLPGIKLLFIENLLMALETKINPSLLPVLHFLYQYEKKLELNPTHLKRRQKLLEILFDQISQFDRNVLLTRVSIEDLSTTVPSWIKEVQVLLEAKLQSVTSPLKAFVSRVFE